MTFQGTVCEGNFLISTELLSNPNACVRCVPDRLPRVSAGESRTEVKPYLFLTFSNNISAEGVEARLYIEYGMSLQITTWITWDPPLHRWVPECRHL